MKIRGFIVALFLLTFTVTPAWLLGMPAPPPPYNPVLISPTAGQVLHPGQTVRVEWKNLVSTLVTYPAWCEIELWLSLDGGWTWAFQITPSMDPNTRFFYWVVPNTPTTSALLDIRYGGEPFYPDTVHTQNASPFVIASAGQ